MQGRLEWPQNASAKPEKFEMPEEEYITFVTNTGINDSESLAFNLK